MKRFWRDVSVGADGAVLLDGKPVRVPGGGVLALPNTGLAAAVAEEWRALGPGFSAADTPLTGLAGAALVLADDVVAAREALGAYARADVICYFADGPEGLVERQLSAWGPWLLYARDVLGAELRTGVGIGFVEQPEAARAALRGALDGADAWALAGLGVLVPALGSLVLGLAVWRGDLGAEAALAAATVDERDQAARWGFDAEAAARAALVARDVMAAARFLALAGGEDTGVG